VSPAFARHDSGPARHLQSFEYVFWPQGAQSTGGLGLARLDVIAPRPAPHPRARFAGATPFRPLGESRGTEVEKYDQQDEREEHVDDRDQGLARLGLSAVHPDDHRGRDGPWVSMFFTFYGLTLLKKKLNLRVTTLGNAAMQMPMFGMHIGMPNLVCAIPGVDAAATMMMKNLIKKKGVATIEELRALAVESDVQLIACQMTMDLFEYTKDDLIEGPAIGGAATYIETATKSDINLFI
jgi:peroxiredoxin family protein